MLSSSSLDTLEYLFLMEMLNSLILSTVLQLTLSRPAMLGTVNPLSTQKSSCSLLILNRGLPLYKEI